MTQKKLSFWVILNNRKVTYLPASCTHLAAASSKACWAGFTPVNASWMANWSAMEASL